MDLLGRKPLAPTDAGEQCLRFNMELLHCFPELTIVKLRPETKRPMLSFDKAREKARSWNPTTRVTILRSWLSKGAGVGLILLQTPLWVLDLDATQGFPSIVDETVQRLRPPQVLTPSGGKHCYFRLPEELIRHPHLKGHVCHPTVGGVVLPLDLKLGGRQTLVVAAGTTRGSRLYRPIDAWRVPPILDPRDLFPGVEILHPHEEQEFDVDPRPLEARIVRAQVYLRQKAPICISGKRAKQNLGRVCSHLTRYLRLPEPLALKLMSSPAGKSWNDRCRDGGTGKPWPWSMEELQAHLRAARRSVPAYGVLERQARLREEARDAKLGLACAVIAAHISAAGMPIAVTNVHAAVLEATGLSHDECTLDRFGKFLRNQGIRRMRKGTKRIQSLMLAITPPDLLDRIRVACSAEPPMEYI